MPDPFNKAKMSGDTHPPEVESEFPLEEGSANAAGTSGTPTDRSQAVESGRTDKPDRGVKKAGLRRDHDGATAGEAARESGRGTQRDRR